MIIYQFCNLLENAQAHNMVVTVRQCTQMLGMGMPNVFDGFVCLKVSYGYPLSSKQQTTYYYCTFNEEFFFNGKENFSAKKEILGNWLLKFGVVLLGRHKSVCLLHYPNLTSSEMLFAALCFFFHFFSTFSGHCYTEPFLSANEAVLVCTVKFLLCLGINIHWREMTSVDKTLSVSCLKRKARNRRGIDARCAAPDEKGGF